MEKMKAKRVHKFIEPYLLTSGDEFRIKDYEPGDTHGLKSGDKDEAKRLLDEGVALLSEMQDKLYVQSDWVLLLMFKAIASAVKDRALTHVRVAVNLHGVD